ncbi:MAG: Rpn family recombination-promoting nuclease/putative transposase [Desulfamplus sp.]|nr:Rpn family recombination-promoting nuclease/putative transposase [Desulfamplus sp.]
MKERLVRFDWAMKKLLRNKANFEILEGFLSELTRQDIKIEKLLESEGNKDAPDDKQNRVDMLAETEQGELVLIELQVESQYDYFHRMVYGTSKLITDYIYSGFGYDMVRRAISINIVYFELGHGRDYVYKGITEFRGIHHNDILELTNTQKNRFKNTDNVSDIFPEYYILKINDFDSLAKDTLDEWIYFLKHSEIKSEFSAKGLKKAAEELDILKLTREERAAYQRYIEDKRVAESSIKTSWFEGKTVGIEEGRKEGREEGELIGKIQLFHEILNEPVPSKKELSCKPVEILLKMLKEVEKRWMQVKK